VRHSEISPFLGRDYKHVADYAPAQGTPAERMRADRLKAKMLCERLLFKKFDRSGALRWAWMQRLGDWGREEGLMKLAGYVATAKLVVILLWWLYK
jgi:hypothetical protein